MKRMCLFATLTVATAVIAGCGGKDGSAKDNMEGGSGKQPDKGMAPPGGESPGKPPAK